MMAWLSDFVVFVEAEKRQAGKLDFGRPLVSRSRSFEKNVMCADISNGVPILLWTSFRTTDPVQAEILWLLASDARAIRLVRMRSNGRPCFLVGEENSRSTVSEEPISDTYRAAQVRGQQGDRLTIHQSFRSGESASRG